MSLSWEADKLIISGDLNLHTVMQVMSSVQQNLTASSGEMLTVDLSQVSHLDSAGVACLVLLQKHTYQNEITISFVNPPDNLRKLAKISDLDEVLSLQ